MQRGRRGPGFWLLAGFFALFVLFLYGPTITILVLSFQGPTGGLTFPMQGVSVHWFGNLFEKQMVGDFAGSFERSMILGVLAMLVTVVASFSAGLAFRTRFRGSALIFYLAIASLIVPSVLVSLGIGLLFRVVGWDPAWYSSAFGAHLTWTLPSGPVTSFNVYRGTTSGGELATPIATGVTVLGYNDSTVTNGQTYYYEVAAVNAGGTGAKSNEVKAAPNTTPAAPAGLTATAGNTIVNLSWTASLLATSYNIYRGVASGQETPFASDVTASPYIDTTLQTGVTYYYYVTAVNANALPAPNQSAPSNEASPANGVGGTFQWTGDGADNNWTTPGNWLGGVAVCRCW